MTSVTQSPLDHHPASMPFVPSHALICVPSCSWALTHPTRHPGYADCRDETFYPSYLPFFVDLFFFGMYVALTYFFASASSFLLKLESRTPYRNEQSLHTNV